MFGKRRKSPGIDEAGPAVLITGAHIEGECDELVTESPAARAAVRRFVSSTLVDGMTLFSTVSGDVPPLVAAVRDATPQVDEVAEDLVDASRGRALSIAPGVAGPSRYFAHLLGNNLCAILGIERDVERPRGWGDLAVVDGAMLPYLMAVDELPRGHERRLMQFTVTMATVSSWLISPERAGLRS